MKVYLNHELQSVEKYDTLCGIGSDNPDSVLPAGAIGFEVQGFSDGFCNTLFSLQLDRNEAITIATTLLNAAAGVLA